MNLLSPIFEAGPSDVYVLELQRILPDAIKKTVEELGHDCLLNFFNGYKDQIDLSKKAA